MTSVLLLVLLPADFTVRIRTVGFDESVTVGVNVCDGDTKGWNDREAVRREDFDPSSELLSLRVFAVELIW